MQTLKAALYAELLKLKRSYMLSATALFFIFISAMMGLLAFVASQPELAAKLGIVGTKAKLFGENDWNGFLSMFNQLLATVGFIGFGFVTSWVFGREYASHTITNLLSLPVSRQAVVLSKFLVILLWCIGLSLLLLAAGILAGVLIDLPGWSTTVLNDHLIRFVRISLLTILLCPPLALAAGIGRGLIAPLALCIFLLIMAQFVAIVGWGKYFPWAVPGLLSISEGTPGMEVLPLSYVLVLLTAIAGILGTQLWWRNADHH
ncbi:ABC transporter permease [Roseimarinus sediminis]|jgi:ABC-2 type transport system permease protein|uniref:ABC transporter permease n=1 Tax=Roseimarinus sediminis TaxID=1610899 RepID=UPI003D20C1C3